MNNSKEFLGTEPIGKLLFKLAVPSVIAQIVNMLYNLVDRVYIGHMQPVETVGKLALTGVGVTFPILTLISAFSAFAGMGGAPLASIRLGAGDRKGAEAILGSAVSMLVTMALVLTLGFSVFQRPLLLAFGASADTIGYATDYLTIYLLGTVFVMIGLGMNPFITSQGFGRTGMMTVGLGAVVNIVLDPVFIFALDMGVWGAALATVLSQAVSCVWVVTFLRGKQTLLRLEKASLPIRPRLILPCVALGTATFIMQASESVISVCFNASLLKYGGDIAVGAMTILSSVMQFALLPLQGISQGSQPLVSYHYGKEDHTGCQKLLRYALTTVCIFAPALFLLVFFFAPQIVRTYLSHAGDELIAYSIGAFRRYSVSYLLLGFNIVIGGFMTAIERPVPAICISVGRGLALQSAVLLLLAAIFGAYAVWYTPIFSEALCLVMSLLFLRSYRRQTDMQA